MTSRFVEQAIARAGLGAIFEVRAAGDVAKVPGILAAAGTNDLLILGAIADELRKRETSDIVHVHPEASPGVVWVGKGASELDLLRAVALARITAPIGEKIGVVWGPIPGWGGDKGSTGLELAQVALGFGATDLTGPITRKSGALITAEDLKKVKGQGMVQASALKRREIAALLTNAGRECVFTDEATVTKNAHEAEAAHV